MKILITQLSFLGDIVLSTPVIRALAELYPDAKLHFLTTKLGASLVQNDPLLKSVIVFDKRGVDSGIKGLLRKAKELRTYGFDRVFCLHKSFRTAILLKFAKIPERIGFSSSSGSWLYTKLRVRKQDGHDVERNLSVLQGEGEIKEEWKELRLGSSAQSLHRKPYIVLFPSSAWKTKMWHWKGFREVAEFSLIRGNKVVILGSTDERENNAKVAYGLPIEDLTGKTTLSETISIVKHANAVVCNDSLGLHIASACKTPTVAIFCATSPEFGFGPWRNRAVIVQEEYLSCKPCRRHGGKRCPVGTEACMRFSSQRVIDALKHIWQ